MVPPVNNRAVALRRRTFFILQRERAELRLGVPISNENFHLRLHITKQDHFYSDLAVDRSMSYSAPSAPYRHDAASI